MHHIYKLFMYETRNNTYRKNTTKKPNVKL